MCDLVFVRCGEETGGLPAQYIPQLARGDPDKWGMAVCTIDGQRFQQGDSGDLFSIQSTRYYRQTSVIALTPH